MGKQRTKKIIGKNPDRLDVCGNFLLSDEALKIGVEAGHRYIDFMSHYNDFDVLMESAIFRTGIIEEATNAIEAAKLNPNFDITIQDLNELFGLITGLEANYERDFMPTGNKYSGYNPF